MRLFWSEPALADLDSIHNFIAIDSAVYADAVVLEILDAVERLIEFPESGRFVPELDSVETRELIVGNYRVMYEVSAADINILTVLHGARHFPS